jgi:hypothetical protein
MEINWSRRWSSVNFKEKFRKWTSFLSNNSSSSFQVRTNTCFMLVCLLTYTSTLKMWATCCSATSVDVQRITRGSENNNAKNVSIYGSTAVCWTSAAFSVSWSFTQTVGFLGRGISPSQGRYLDTGQHRYPWFEWDSNTRSQCLSERRQFMPSTALPVWSAQYYRYWTKFATLFLRRIPWRRLFFRFATLRSTIL